VSTPGLPGGRHTILVAGVGNVFLGDDGFGVAVAERLATEELPAAVRVEDFGIRGVHLAYELLNGYDLAILVDAVARGGEPGTIYVIEPEAGDPPASGCVPGLDGHGMQPEAVIRLLATLGGDPSSILVVGCEPGVTEERVGLSEPVAAAVEPAAGLIRDLIGQAVARPAAPAASTDPSRERRGEHASPHPERRGRGGAGVPVRAVHP
jgi:hydrogenase maturation protease